MMKLVKQPQYNKALLLVVALLCLLGITTLFSASLSLLDSKALFYRTMIVQIAGLLIGSIIIYFAIYLKQFDYRLLYKKNYALWFFLGTIVIQLLVFSPLGVSKNGALRWLDIGLTTIQPSELLKIGAVLAFAALLVTFRKEIKSFRTLLFITSLSLGIVVVLMFLVRDKGTLIITLSAIFAMMLVSRIRLFHFSILMVFFLIMIAGYVAFAPSEQYVRERFSSFTKHTVDPQGRDYQIRQSTMTVGSGMLAGKGFGKSIQKYQYLPEPLTDSIFAIYAEERGFVGSVVLILLFFSFLYLGFQVARTARDEYGRYAAVGLTILIFIQFLINVMAMIDLLPLSGMPLVFVSKGGSSLVTSLMVVALLLNISRVNGYSPRRKSMPRKRRSVI